MNTDPCRAPGLTLRVHLCSSVVGMNRSGTFAASHATGRTHRDIADRWPVPGARGATGRVVLGKGPDPLPPARGAGLVQAIVRTATARAEEHRHLEVG